jgi:predicted FMN-binding regulatory protein PaiB
MNQNRSEADIDGVIRGLSELDVVKDHVVADIVRQRRPEKNYRVWPVRAGAG